ncbi:phospholipase D-like domain-containing protein [Allokutzneria sp. A3M-2-11 16]|uniref:phospholipase D-like domain-containing protein n=1 Tax=Allokutzneria sp. A3M-2-11 16 TaxID=2962043 RepID=UPI0020B721FF|nr:phospholipase D-like domain-containing protein [Allokutzneria sp. A3M-2-11 16]MCP3802585.1 phospholipase D-like domain-containing protein [Allokutzneria sp. A3M-2-11 16]
MLAYSGFDVIKHESNPVARLLAAHARGVRVILPEELVGKPAHAQLKAALGADDTKPNHVVTCGARRGCIATRQTSWSTGYLHTKFAAFSKVRMNDGTVVSDVVHMGSSNLGDWDAVEAYNDMFTFTDAKVHKAFRTYFTDLTRYRRTAAGNNFDNTPGKRDLQVHSKTIMIDGRYDDDTTPRVYTGSHNLAWSALRQGDEVLMRVTGGDAHDEYLRQFTKIHTTCKNRA